MMKRILWSTTPVYMSILNAAMDELERFIISEGPNSSDPVIRISRSKLVVELKDFHVTVYSALSTNETLSLLFVKSEWVPEDIFGLRTCQINLPFEMVIDYPIDYVYGESQDAMRVILEEMEKLET